MGDGHLRFLRVLFGRGELLPLTPSTKGQGMTSWRFWRMTTERAVKTAAQFGLVFLGADAFNILETDLMAAGGFALAGAVVSVLTSMASAPFSETGTPSVVDQ